MMERYPLTTIVLLIPFPYLEIVLYGTGTLDPFSVGLPPDAALMVLWELPPGARSDLTALMLGAIDLTSLVEEQFPSGYTLYLAEWSILDIPEREACSIDRITYYWNRRRREDLN